MPRRSHRKKAALLEIALAANWKYAASLSGCALLGALSVLAPASTASAAQAIYRCEHDGRVTYRDRPCERPVIQPGGAAPATKTAKTATEVDGGDPKPYGPWRGQAQFQVMHAGLRSENTHIVTPLIVHLADDGKVTGAGVENRCELLGIASPGLSPTVLNLDVTLSNCPAHDLNQRYQGSLHLDSGSGSAQLRLQATKIGVGQSSVADIKATMRR